ncbi:MAG: NAD(P)-binding domain-containing protein, partial [Bacteroidota bacterium]
MKTVNYIILGAGPAGCQLAYFLQKAGVDYSILERGAEPGTTFKKYPVHGKLISINKVHTGIDDPAINLRWDWNSLLNEDQKIKFGDYTKEYFPDAVVMVNYLQDFIKEYQLNVQYNTHISQISREGEGYKLKDKEGNEYLGQRLIVATGVSLPWVPDVPGIEHAKPYSELSLDKEEYTNKRVLILGKGNSAFETADYLTDTAAVIFACSPNHIKLAWSSHYVGHLRAVNNNFLDTYHLKSQNAVLDAHVLGIVKKGEEYHVSLAYQNETDESEVLVFDK